jgi:hypothetical protein
MALDKRKEGTYGFFSVNTAQEDVAPKIFMFPLSREGIETVKSKKDLRNKLKKKFREAYKQKQIQCSY